jgi:hypothetical protein
MQSKEMKVQRSWRLSKEERETSKWVMVAS